MHHARTGLILAYHGCDKSVADKLISSNGNLKPSSNDYDWLGHGVYFWENSHSRALDFAKELKKKPKPSIKNPAVIGAVIDLGHCLNLLDFENLKLVKQAHTYLEQMVSVSHSVLPTNKMGSDLLLRNLDCAVIETLHELRDKSDLQNFDSVRGLFSEGTLLYPNAGFRSKDHIQLCIRNLNCIKGFFHPRKHNNRFTPI